MLECIRERFSRLGVAPTFDEIADACSCSTSTVWQHVQRLWREGRLVQKKGFWGHKYIPSDAQLPPVDPMVERAYRAGLSKGWELGCNLDQNGYRRARDTGFNPFLSAEERQ